MDIGVVSTIAERCKRCYSCVRECPVKAIRVEHGQATVVEERCISCGSCVRVCAQKAKRIEDGIKIVRPLLASDVPVVACLAPSFVAAFDELQPGQVVAGLRLLGFSEVWEVAVGAELVSEEYERLYGQARELGVRVISTTCPAIVRFIQKHEPKLVPILAPIVSPMIATSRAIRKRHEGKELRVVFIGPCVAKKAEARESDLRGDIDCVLTFGELRQLFDEARVIPHVLEKSEFDSPRAGLGRLYPISGGLAKSCGLQDDVLETDLVKMEGRTRAMAAIGELAAGQTQGKFFDLLFCEGCIGGPVMLNNLSVIVRHQILVRYLRQRLDTVSQSVVRDALKVFDGITLYRGLEPKAVSLISPQDKQVEVALRSIGRWDNRDRLNCGACGYRSCWEHAVAISQGLAEPEMCLPHVLGQLELSCESLQESHRQLAEAEELLVQTERLASMGQLSAGVAHEVNNPLGSILIYSHMMLKQLGDDDPLREDLQMILREATRCRNIVRGLLAYARQTRVAKSKEDISEVIDEVWVTMVPAANEKGIELIPDITGDLPLMMIDRHQIRQMLVNLVQNAIEASPKGGQVRLAASASPGGETMYFEVSDQGCGISKERLSKVFTPRFSSAELGKGMGLGPAIAYGVVKMHSGAISVTSEEGKGTTFFVSLPTRTSEVYQAASVGEGGTRPSSQG